MGCRWVHVQVVAVLLLLEHIVTGDLEVGLGVDGDGEPGLVPRRHRQLLASLGRLGQSPDANPDSPHSTSEPGVTVRSWSTRLRSLMAEQPAAHRRSSWLSRRPRRAGAMLS